MKTGADDRRGGLLPEAAGEALALLALSLLFGCTSATEPLAPVTLLVANGTCDAGECSTLQVRGFPADQPHTPGGLWSIELGTVTAASACLTLPATASFRVTDAGTGETRTYSWSGDDALTLGAGDPDAGALQATPSTVAFVPASASGWSVTLPGGAAPSPAAACR